MGRESSTMPALIAVARERLRRGWRATLGLVVFAGLTAAVPMAVWSASKEASNSLERFVERADAADVTMFVCPPGYDPSAEGDPGPCFAHDPHDELGVVRSLPNVEQAARFGYSPAIGGLSRDPATWRPLGISGTRDRVATATILGDPIVVAGRVAAVEAPDELMMTEAAARSLGVKPGDRIRMQPDGADAEGAAVVATIAGVIRTPAGLLPLSPASVGEPSLYARPGWVRAHGAQFTTFGAVAVWLDESDRDGFVDRLRRELDQVVRSEPMFPSGERDSIDQAIDLESRAGMLTAAVFAIAAAFFVGQAVSRQGRVEGSDTPTLLALGFTRRGLAATAALRWAPVVLGATALAIAGTLAASALGPIGVGRRGPWEGGVHADWPVLLTGTATVAALVMFVGVTAARGRRDSPALRAAPPAALIGAPGLRTGVGLAWRSLGRGTALSLVSAVVATALAIAMVITAAGVAASLNHVTTHPARFGAPWDVLVEGQETASASALVRTPGVSSAALIVGTDVAIGDDAQVWTQALLPVAGIRRTPPVITAGREPSNAREIALGALTRRRAGVDMEDTITVRGATDGAPLSYRVVGVTMVTDGFEPNVGHGALVTPEGLDRIDPSATEFPQLALSVVDGQGRSDALAELREARTHLTIPFPIPASLANAERIERLPLLLAAGAAAVAAITLTHALILSIRRNRRELTVCRVLGFTRGQVYTAVATHATLVALAAIIVGVPLGLAGARWGWATASASFGVVSGLLLPVWVVAASALATVLVANLAAGPPARAVTRQRPSEALRTE